VVGSEGGLVGVLAEPSPAQARPGAPAILMADVGLQHRVGPYRVWVELARQLAAAGYPSLRFDLSGLGDSAPRRDSRDEQARATADMREAMDFLAQKKGIQRFIVLGFCSGTDSAHSIAVQDPRVAGMVWIDGYAYRTPRFERDWRTRRFLDKARWRVFLNRLRERLRPSAKARGVGEEIYTREYPEPAQLSQQLEALLARGAHLLAIYSGGADYTYGYAEQFFEMFPADFRGRIDTGFYPAADHLFTGVPERERLLAQLGGWIRQRYPLPPAA
jgi:pimeloyl-ACP methyl ester carboxylesterase